MWMVNPFMPEYLHDKYRLDSWCFWKLIFQINHILVLEIYFKESS